MNRLKTFALSAVMAAGLALPAHAQTVTPGYNALEVTPSTQGALRTRLWTGADVHAHGMVFGYAGLNETNDLQAKNYFGKQELSIGKEAGRVRAIAWMKTTNSGSLDSKIGLRTSLDGIKGGFGFLETTTNSREGNITLLYGHGLGRGYSADLFHEWQQRYDGAGSNYTELQLNKSLGKHIDIFGRAELVQFSHPNYLAGFRLK